MPATGVLYSPTAPIMPRAVPSKFAYRPAPVHRAPFRPAGSPPRASPSASSSAVPSLTNGSYARSTSSDRETTSSGAHGIDLIDMMTERVSTAVNPIPMDRTIAKQAQTSGTLHAKQQELAELQALATRRLRGAKANFAEGRKAANEVHKDLQWTQKRVSQLNSQAAKKYPAAYKKAAKRYPSPEC